MKKKPPFFILGCVRSGTTLLRDILRHHPNLAAPEETQFFRWAEPFGAGMQQILTNNAVLKRHRALDGITEKEFHSMLQASPSRAGLYWRYMQLYLDRNKPTATRWFDKSPQNVYGAAMIAMEFPSAKFIHIVRNPFDVVSSLRIGKVVKVTNLIGACCYWNEAAEIIQVIKKAFPSRIYEVKYEEFTRDPLPEIEKMLAFIGEDFDPDHYRDVVTNAKQHEYSNLFSAPEIKKITQLCSRWGTHYGYIDAPEERATSPSSVGETEGIVTVEGSCIASPEA